ncbi:MAG: hypothetical protein AB8E87_04030 [Prochlorococcus sp.]
MAGRVVIVREGDCRLMRAALDTNVLVYAEGVGELDGQLQPSGGNG